MRYFFLLFSCVLSLHNADAQQEATTHDGRIVILHTNGTWEYKSQENDLGNLEIPKCHPDSIISHKAYSLRYSEEHEQALWVAYQLKATDLEKKAERTDDFRPDPAISTGSADLPDYKGSGYDRGHLAPAGDMVRSEDVMSESFFFSNMSPQNPGFNRGIWRQLEERVRDWTKTFDSLYVVTGPDLSEVNGKIGPNEVSIPKKYYKVLLAKTDSTFIGLGFMLMNQSSSEDLELFTYTIDEVELATGIDFFPQLNDSTEFETERQICYECWGLTIIPKKPTVHPNNTKSIQCKGQTNSGKRCSRKTTDASGYCYQHKK